MKTIRIDVAVICFLILNSGPLAGQVFYSDSLIKILEPQESGIEVFHIHHGTDKKEICAQGLKSYERLFEEGIVEYPPIEDHAGYIYFRAPYFAKPPYYSKSFKEMSQRAIVATIIIDPKASFVMPSELRAEALIQNNPPLVIKHKIPFEEYLQSIQQWVSISESDTSLCYHLTTWSSAHRGISDCSFPWNQVPTHYNSELIVKLPIVPAKILARCYVNGVKILDNRK